MWTLIVAKCLELCLSSITIKIAAIFACVGPRNLLNVHFAHMKCCSKWNERAKQASHSWSIVEIKRINLRLIICKQIVYNIGCCAKLKYVKWCAHYFDRYIHAEQINSVFIRKQETQREKLRCGMRVREREHTFENDR